MVDNGSAFTENLVDFLHEKDTHFVMQSPEELDLESLTDFSSFILSGRKHNNRQTNKINSKIVLHAVSNNKMLLGICYGAQIMALALGGTIKKSPTPRRGIRKITIQKKTLLFPDTLTVFESHSFEISCLPKELISLGGSNDCKYEIIRYGQKPIIGTQFHPEMSLDGRHLIARFLGM